MQKTKVKSKPPKLASAYTHQYAFSPIAAIYVEPDNDAADICKCLDVIASMPSIQDTLHAAQFHLMQAHLNSAEDTRASAECDNINMQTIYKLVDTINSITDSRPLIAKHFKNKFKLVKINN
jgi:hypothetical protein